MSEDTRNYSSEDDARFNGSTEEIDKMVEIIEKADEIRRDEKLYKLVMNRMDGRGKRMRSIADLRGVLADADSHESDYAGR